MAAKTTPAHRPAEDLSTAEETRAGYYYRPLVDIYEKQDELVVELEVPGADPQQIDVNFEDGLLTIHAKVPPRQPENTNYLVQEYGTGDYYRCFRVSEAIDAAKISAEYSEGVLRLHLPKVEAVKARKVEVKVV